MNNNYQQQPSEYSHDPQENLENIVRARLSEVDVAVRYVEGSGLALHPDLLHESVAREKATETAAEEMVSPTAKSNVVDMVGKSRQDVLEAYDFPKAA